MNLVSLDSFFNQLSIDILFFYFHRGLTLNFMFDQLMFKIDLNLGVDFQGQLLLIYKVKFDIFGFFRILLS